MEVIIRKPKMYYLQGYHSEPKPYSTYIVFICICMYFSHDGCNWNFLQNHIQPRESLNFIASSLLPSIKVCTFSRG
jgi:hypothetical protein